MRTRTLTTLAAAAALTASALAFGVTPSTVGAADAGVAGTATRSGGTVAFSGQALLADPGAQDVFGTPTAFTSAEVADAVGADLAGAAIEELEDGSGLRFTWKMGSDLPATGIPEGLRYNWAFGFGDGQSFQLQVKRTNVANISTLEDPLDHANEATTGDYWFQLRGACTDAYLPAASPQQIAGCYHLGFLEGSVDAAAGTVSMDVPYDTRDDIGRLVGEGFTRGSSITEAQSAGMSITASLQAVVSNTLTSQFINGWGTYYTGTAVHVALGDADRATGSYTLLDTPGDGSFAGQLTGAGTHLWVKACRGYHLVPVVDACTEQAIAIG